MGNHLTQESKIDPLKSFDDFLSNSPELREKVGQQTDNKIFRSYMCKLYDQGVIFLKIGLRRQKIDTAIHLANFHFIRERLDRSLCLNLIGYAKQVNLDKEEDLVMLFRQGLYTTLQDQFEVEKRLNTSQKLHLVSQILIAVFYMHTGQIYHGDIKASNVLLTREGNAVLTDLAFYKPYYLHRGEYSDYQNYYNSSRNQSASLAPEKFLDDQVALTEPQLLANMDVALLETLQQMDMFSLGCLIYQIMKDGRHLLGFEQLQSYSKRQMVIADEDLLEIAQSPIRQLLKTLLSVQPEERLDIKDTLTIWYQQVMPDASSAVFFYKLQHVLSQTTFHIYDYKIAFIYSIFPIVNTLITHTQPPKIYHTLPISLQKIDFIEMFINSYQQMDHQLLSVLNQFEIEGQDIISQMKRLVEHERQLKNEKGQYKYHNGGNLEMQDIQRQIKKYKELEKTKNPFCRSKSVAVFMEDMGVLKEERMVESNLGEMLLEMLCSWLRSFRYQGSKYLCMEVISELSMQDEIGDRCRLRVVLVYLSSLFDDDLLDCFEESTTALAFHMFIQVVCSMRVPIQSAQDIRVFQKVVWKTIKDASRIENKIVRTALAQSFTQICHIGQLLTHYAPELITDIRAFLVMYLKDRLNCDNHIQIILIQQLPNIIGMELFPLVVWQVELLPLIISGFNKSVELKVVCLQTIPSVFAMMDAFDMVYPCIEYYLYCHDQSIVLEVIRCLGQIVEVAHKSEPISITKLAQMLTKVVPLLLSPIPIISHQTVQLVILLFQYTSSIHFYAYLRPLLLPYLKQPLISFHQDFSIFIPVIHDYNFKKVEFFPHPYVTYLKLFYHNYSKKQSSSKKMMTGNEPVERQASQVKDMSIHIGSQLKDFLINCYWQGVFRFLNLDSQGQNDFLKTFLLAKKNKQTARQEQQQQKDLRVFFSKYKVDIDKTDVDSPKKTLLELVINLIQNANDQFRSLHCPQGRMPQQYLQVVQQILLDGLNLINKLQQLEPQSQAKRVSPVTCVDEENQQEPKTFKQELVCTLYEHNDVVSTLQQSKRFVVSGSYDGCVKLYDPAQLEGDYSTGMTVCVQLPDQQINCLALTNTTTDNYNYNENVVVGSKTGQLDVLRVTQSGIKTLASYQKKDQDIQAVQYLPHRGENTFVSLSRQGFIGVEDSRAKHTAYGFTVTQRGLMSSLCPSANGNMVYVSSLDGYLLVYDLRCNLISSIFRTNNAQPITKLQPFPPHHYDSNEQEYLSIAIQGQHNHICAFNMTSYGENIQPYLQYSSTQSTTICHSSPYLVNQQKYEQFINYHHNYASKTQNLLHLHKPANLQPQQNVDQLLQYLSDPLQVNQHLFTQNIHRQHHHLLDKVQSYYSQTQFSYNHRFTASFANKTHAQYQLITVGSDRNISAVDFQLPYNSNAIKVSGYHINNPLTAINNTASSNYYAQNPTNDSNNKTEANRYQALRLNGMIQITEIQTNPSKNQNYDDVNHHDWITDFIQIEREKNSYILTSSRDNTIKLWK